MTRAEAIEASKQRILAMIDKACAPVEMSPTEALEFLDDLAGEIEARSAALRDDL